MVSFSSLFLAGCAAASVLAAPGSLVGHSKRQTITTPTTGTNNGYYFSFWTNGDGTVDYTNGAGGEYSVSWQNDGDFTAGKGWNPGSAQDITFSGTFTTTGNAYLAVYGWFTTPLVEYYILENYGDYNPGSAMTEVGSLTSDGSAYTIYTHTQTNQPSILGTSTFQQYWSIRQDLRSSGTVTTANHFNAWNSLGLTTGTFNYQIIVTEGYESSGSSNITVGSSPGGGGTSPTSTSPTSTTTHATSTTHVSTTSVTTPTGTLVPLYGQCGGNTWTGPTTCASPNTCQVLNPGYYQCLSPPSTTTGTPGSGSGSVQHYGQCGGNNWTGATTCASPYTCQVLNSGYSQCL